MTKMLLYSAFPAFIVEEKFLGQQYQNK